MPMKLSTKGRYGLSAMIDLAVYSENEAVSLNSIAERQHISEGYLEQLMAKLKKAGLVTSIRRRFRWIPSGETCRRGFRGRYPTGSGGQPESSGVPGRAGKRL